MMRLHHIPADPQLPWQWWHPSPTDGRSSYGNDRQYAGPRYRERMDSETYVAGFATEAEARRYGAANGWTSETGAEHG